MKQNWRTINYSNDNIVQSYPVEAKISLRANWYKTYIYIFFVFRARARACSTNVCTEPYAISNRFRIYPKEKYIFLYTFRTCVHAGI